MNLLRCLRHLLLPDWWRRRVFSTNDLAAIEAAVAASEMRHRGELRFIIEAGLPPADLWHDRSPRERAAGLFARYRVWDTEENSGILIYLQLVDRRVEILADRGITARVAQAEWDAICRGMEAEFRAGRWREGAVQAVTQASALLVMHFPATGHNPNELPDSPVLL